MKNVFGVSIFFILSVLIIGSLFLISTNMIGTYIHPLFKSLYEDQDQGIQEDQYNSILDKLKIGTNWHFYIILAIPFIFLIMKLLYERENTSVYYR